MKRIIVADVLINVLVPVLAGMYMYYLKIANASTLRLYHHLPDGLWAYAFTSAILITWRRRPNIFWISAIFFMSVLFEWMQWIKLVPGTPDLLDLFTYFLFICFALYTNQWFRSGYH